MLAVFSATLPAEHPDLQIARGNLANTKYAMGDSAGALALREKVLAVQLATLPDDHPDLQSARGNLAGTKRKLGDFAGAHALQEKALAVQLAKLPDDHPDLQSARANLAIIKFWQGDLADAQALQEKVLAARLATLPDDHRDVQTARGALAGTKHELGDLAGALALQEKVFAVQLATLPDDHHSLQNARSNLAYMKRGLGDSAGAQALQEKVVAVFSAKLPDDHSDVQMARGGLAATKHVLGDLAGALALQEKVFAVQLATLADDHPRLSVTRTNLAGTKRKLGDLAGALALEEKVLAVYLATLPGEHPNLWRARGSLAVTKYELGDFVDALALQEKVLAVCSATLPDDHPNLQIARGNLANTRYVLGDLTGAAQLYRAAVAGAVCRLSTQMTSLRDIVGLARQSARPLSLVASLLDLGTAVPAEVAIPLRLDGLQLLEATRSAPLHLSRLQQSIRSQHPEASARLRPQLTVANRRLSVAVAFPAEGRRGPDGEQISPSDEIREATLAKDAIEREWLALIPPDALMAPDAATLAKALAQDEAAISFCTYTPWMCDSEKPWVETSQKRYGAFLLKSSGDVTWHSLAATAKVDSVIAEIRNLAVHRVADRAGLASRLVELRTLLLDPVLAAIPTGTKSLVLSLADEMHLLPLDDIPLASGKLLGDAFSVRSVWALRSLLQAPRNCPSDPSALVVGGPDYDTKPSSATPTLPEVAIPTVKPFELSEAHAVDASGTTGSGYTAPEEFDVLPHAKRESEKLVTTFKESFAGRVPSTLLAAAASESSVVARAPGKHFLHFVTHGYFAPELAWKAAVRGDESSLARFDLGRDRVAQLSPYSLTGIALAGASLPADELGRREGILTAQEIAHLDLSACYLTTLSACETSLGVRQAGSGLASLRQAFHAAGARFVLATLWRVDDEEAANLMTDFYSRVWKQGQDPRTALRAAKATARKRGTPYRDWGGWVLAGR